MTSTHPATSRPGLRLMLDTAERAAWAEWLPLGCFYGVTTNPMLLQAAGLPYTLAELSGLARYALDLGAGEVHLQTWGRTRDLYFEHGRALAALSPKVVVKVPTTVEGVAAAANLAREGARLTMTSVFTAAQALIASALGAEYAAPYLGRMNDAGHDGFREIAMMARTAREQGSSMRILVASLRHPGDVVRLAADGLDTFTFSPKLAAGFFTDEEAAHTVEAFEAAAEPNRAAATDASIRNSGGVAR
jgi:transaldolase